jgi:hypothetical protein
MPAISPAVESIDQHEALAAATSAECDPIGLRQCFSKHHQLVQLDVRHRIACAIGFIRLAQTLSVLKRDVRGGKRGQFLLERRQLERRARSAL